MDIHGYPWWPWEAKWTVKSIISSEMGTGWDRLKCKSWHDYLLLWLPADRKILPSLHILIIVFNITILRRDAVRKLRAGFHAMNPKLNFDSGTNWIQWRWYRLDRWNSNSGALHFEPHNRRVWASDPRNSPRFQWKCKRRKRPSQA